MEGLEMNGRRIKRSFWKGKKVLLTGNTGFKGSWLSLWLKMLGADPVGYSLAPPTDPSIFEGARIGGIAETTRGDVRDLDSLKAAIAKHSPGIIIHMAAQSLVRRSYMSPVETFGANVMGTVNVLDAVRCAPSVRAVVIVTTDKCYENGDGKVRSSGFAEDDRLGGHDPYSGSKACAELVTAAYTKSYFNPENFHGHGVAVASARAGNVIGGGDWSEDRLIPDCIRAVNERRRLIVRHPDAIRPWQHVMEPLYGYLLLAERLYEEGPAFSGPWNFGPSREGLRPVKWIVERVVTLLGAPDAGWTTDRSRNPHEHKSLTLDSTKARLELGWRTSWDIETALVKTAEWFRAYSDNKDMMETTARQIRDYEVAVSEGQRVRDEVQVL